MTWWIAGALLLVPGPLRAQAPGADAADTAGVTVQVRDLSPRFLRFYEAARAESAGPERRWALWKEHYDFAALPPVPERDSLARGMLEDAWPRYPEVLERIRAGAEGLQPAPQPLLRRVAARLEADRPLRLGLVLYVGALEGNAFFAASGGTLTVAAPVEEEPDRRTLTLAHEFTHAVHHVLAGFGEGWERSIARTLFAEGLAMRTAEALFPGRDPAVYVEYSPGWLAQAEARRGEVLRGILPYLRESRSEVVMRFTMGTGSTGLEREAYYAGWVVVGELQRQGHTLAQLARIPESELPALVEKAVEALLAGPPAP